jgi:hypothetical protein
MAITLTTVGKGAGRGMSETNQYKRPITITPIRSEISMSKNLSWYCSYYTPFLRVNSEFFEYLCTSLNKLLIVENVSFH